MTYNNSSSLNLGQLSLHGRIANTTETYLWNGRLPLSSSSAMYPTSVDRHLLRSRGRHIEATRLRFGSRSVDVQWTENLNRG